MSKFCSLEEAVSGIQSGQTVASVGVIGWITPDALLKGLGDRYEKEQHPRDLTFYFPCGTGDAMDIGGMDRVARKGLMKRIVAGSYINPVHPQTGERPKLMQLIRENAIEAYSWPIGASMHWLREVARKSPGYLTKIGLGAYIDPDQDGGKFTALATDDLVEKVSFKGEDYLFYPTWPLHHCFIRATSADEFGNLSFENEGLLSAALALALATKACGGTVTAQVTRQVERFTRDAGTVRIPGDFVDNVVIVPDQMMVTDTPFDTRYLSPKNMQLETLPKIPFGPDKIIGRRAYLEVPKRTLTILGFGASSDMPLVMAEDGALNAGNIDDYRFTTEHGSYGGVVMTGWQFSTNMWPEALVDGVTQFDAIDGGLCECTALSFAEFDAQGSVNVSKFGAANPGAGGFTDIAHNAKKLIFTGTFTAGGLKVSAVDGVLRIDQEGKNKKLVPKAQHITYAVSAGVAERGQEALLITERAVFQIHGDGLELIEIAPGIDLQKDVLDQMAFQPKISARLKTMDAWIFKDEHPALAAV
ncbi:acyl CoA:acetate/3-ketoacid CoA transferase [Pollutimonas bauzanensis]|uniref:Acetate CoA-transferase YdiF n=1 Tax=Pollutimonas bauzanensis TaxID=658167 RepID=A0A1M5SCW6_9BURK|nr:CoA-transferase [Pollutimonas bauzanensis]SHH36374.1 propionate CoA-transferase [Pollutimonas bauzanensis]